MSETVTLSGRDGSEVEARAEITRFTDGQRLTKALPIGVGGTVLGLATIVIPGLHLVSVWAVPLLSIGIAVYMYNRRGLLGEVHGRCPKCERDMQAEGGAWEDPMYVRCNHCQTPYEVALSKPM